MFASRMDTHYFDIVAGVQQRDTLVTYLFIICLDYVLRTFIDKMKDNGCKLAKEESRRYPAQRIMDADNADYLALLANIHAHPKTLLWKSSHLHSLPCQCRQDEIHVL